MAPQSWEVLQISFMDTIQDFVHVILQRYSHLLRTNVCAHNNQVTHIFQRKQLNNYTCRRDDTHLSDKV